MIPCLVVYKVYSYFDLKLVYIATLWISRSSVLLKLGTKKCDLYTLLIFVSKKGNTKYTNIHQLRNTSVTFSRMVSSWCWFSTTVRTLTLCCNILHSWAFSFASLRTDSICFRNSALRSESAWFLLCSASSSAV